MNSDNAVIGVHIDRLDLHCLNWVFLIQSVTWIIIVDFIFLIVCITCKYSLKQRTRMVVKKNNKQSNQTKWIPTLSEDSVLRLYCMYSSGCLCVDMY